MRAYLAGIAGSLALLLAGCAGPAAMTHAGGEEEWVIEQPYHHPLAGVGGGAIVGSVLVKENREVPFASRTLVLVLQDQQLSLRKPEIGVDGIIPPRVPWATDIAPLPPEVVAAHNQKFPTFVLAPATYGIAYDGEHDTSNNAFRFKISARLHQKGAISNWSPVRDDRYSGQFFVQRLAEAIKARLKSGEGQ